MAPKATSPQRDALATQIHFFLRFIQQGSIVLTGFVACYFVYWHIILKDDIPIPLFILIGACSLTYLESYLFSALSLSQRDAPLNYSLLIRTSTPCSGALTIGYCALRKVPFLTKWCEGDNWFKPIRETNGYTLAPAGVEEHHCALACVIIAAGAVALVFTGFITAFAIMGVVKEWRPSEWKLRPRGYAVIGEEGDESDDDSAFDEEDVENKM